MTQLTRSPSLVALIASAAALPTFLLALPAGALADILDRRRLITVTQIWQMAVAALMGVAAQAAMRDVGRARRRDGALQWTLATDAERPTRHVKSYLVPSWAEHEREQSRLTRADARPLQTAYDLHCGQAPPSIRYLVGHRGHLHPHGRGTNGQA